jgi:hypothetical protein
MSCCVANAMDLGEVGIIKWSASLLSVNILECLWYFVYVLMHRIPSAYVERRLDFSNTKQTFVCINRFI